MISALSNVSSLRATSSLARSQRDISVSLERLSSGKRINRAADDPGGLIAVNDFEGRIREINAILKGFDQEEALLGAREGATSGVQDLTTELRALVVSAANRGGQSSEELDALQLQVDGIIGAIDFVSNTATFKGVQILRGFNSGTIGAGAVTAADGSSYTLNDLKTGGRLNLRTGDLDSAGKLLEAATSSVSTDRATVGSRLKAIDASRAALSTELANVDSARSAIEDADYAEETAKLVRAQTLQQAAIYVKQAAQDQQAGAVLELLRGVVDVSRNGQIAKG